MSIEQIYGVRWPLSDEQRTNVMRLGELIRRCGAARFTQAHLVRADARDFPDPWEPTLRGFYRLLHRLFWHAHLDPDIVIEDVRSAPDPRARLLTNSAIDFIEASEGRATFQVAAFGNDDVAGLTSHAIGAALLQLSPPDPFRGTQVASSSELDASIAACYLGLGVLVANASMYRRHASRLVGREVISEQRIEQTGGLTIADATLLLAAQLTVRDDVPGAIDTLHGPQREWLDRWLAALDAHEAELCTLLNLDDPAVSTTLPSRAPEPREPAAVAERAPAVRNEGCVSYRVPRRLHRMWAGLGLGFVLALMMHFVAGPSPSLLLLFPICAIGGYLVARQGFACAACETTLLSELPMCPTCRATLPETLVTREQRATRLAEFAARREEVDPAHAAEAEAAYHPDV